MHHCAHTGHCKIYFKEPVRIPFKADDLRAFFYTKALERIRQALTPFIKLSIIPPKKVPIDNLPLWAHSCCVLQ
ncbi:hypothetical protein ES703_77803 [subsurface metagenome]